jgi:hypothetical protein
MPSESTMHPNSLEALERRLNTALQQTKVEIMFVNWTSLNENLTEFYREILKTKGDWISQRDVLLTIANFINEEMVKESAHLKNTATVSLVDLLGEAVIKNIADRTINYFDSIPRPYQFYFYLPVIKTIGALSIPLSESASLIELRSPGDNRGLWETVPQKPAPIALNALVLGGGLANSRKTPEVFLKIDSNGFFDSTLESSAVKSAYSLLKQVIIFGYCCGLFEKSWTSLVTQTASICSCYSSGDSGYLETEIPESNLEFLATINLSGEVNELATPNKATRIVDKFKYATKLLVATSEDAIEIRTAAEWMFDALCAENETIAFMQYAIGFEAILGGSIGSDEPLSKTLADRLSFLIGKNRSDRKTIREDFLEFYRVRGKIVHGRAARLSIADRKWLEWARQNLLKVIRQELEVF